ncbi:MAG: DUF1246 domain-containing protein, partial [Patescibacteria group bacterium]
MNPQDLLRGYDLQHLTIGTLGGHSALDVCSGAKKYGFGTVVVAQKGREKTYEKYFRTRTLRDAPPAERRGFASAGGEASGGLTIGCVDDVIILKNFKDVVKKEIQEDLRKRNTIFIQSR